MDGHFFRERRFHTDRQQYLNFKLRQPEVDVWAAAATLYYMLTVRAPRDFSAPDFDPGAYSRFHRCLSLNSIRTFRRISRRS
jgi:serine/threonine protein kinase